MFDAEVSARIEERWQAVAAASAERRNHWHESWDEPLDALTASLDAARKCQSPQAWRAVSVQGRAVREVLESNNDGAEHALYPLVTRLTDTIDKGLDALASEGRELYSPELLAGMKAQVHALEQAATEDRQKRQLWEIESKKVLDELLATTAGAKREINSLEDLLKAAAELAGFDKVHKAFHFLQMLLEYVEKQRLVERIKAAGRELRGATGRFIRDTRARFGALKLPWRRSAAESYFDPDNNKGLRIIVRDGARDGEVWRVPGAGVAFQDCWEQNGRRVCGPEMVLIPAGEFMMGSPDDEPERRDTESPRHKVTIRAPFAVSRFAVTFDEWDAAAADGGCGGYKPKDRGWGRGRQPVINVNWNDAQAYAKWLREKTGKGYRLLSEAEWEYVARAGTVTPFWWGPSISTDQANYDGNHTYAGGKRGEYRQKTVPVDQFPPNPWGLYQVHGNVWQWCEDRWNENYNGAPDNGFVWTAGDSGLRVLRGGAWGNDPRLLRAADRFRNSPGNRYVSFGFRLARTLNP